MKNQKTQTYFKKFNKKNQQKYKKTKLAAIYFLY